MNLFARFARNEGGATAIGYGVIAALIGAVIITVASQIGREFGPAFAQISPSLARTAGGGSAN